jgi:hypothetical protein
MKSAIDMGLGTMIYVPNFMKSDSGIHKLIGGNHRHADIKVFT